MSNFAVLIFAVVLPLSVFANEEATPGFVNRFELHRGVCRMELLAGSAVAPDAKRIEFTVTHVHGVVKMHASKRGLGDTTKLPDNAQRWFSAELPGPTEMVANDAPEALGISKRYFLFYADEHTAYLGQHSQVNGAKIDELAQAQSGVPLGITYDELMGAANETMVGNQNLIAELAAKLMVVELKFVKGSWIDLVAGKPVCLELSEEGRRLLIGYNTGVVAELAPTAEKLRTVVPRVSNIEVVENYVGPGYALEGTLPQLKLTEPATRIAAEFSVEFP